MKDIVKFKCLDQEGFLSCVSKDGYLYALVKKDTPKVKSILESNQLLISYELKTPSYQKVDAKVSFDASLISWVFHKLEEEKNLYFKELDDTLCVIEIMSPKSVHL